MAETEDLELSEAKQASGKMKLVVIVVGAVLLLGTGAGVGLYFGGVFNKSGETPKAMQDEPPEIEKKEAVYVDLGPPYTVNLQAGSKANYLEISLQALTRDPKVEDVVRTYLPEVRNNLMMLFSGKTSQELDTTEGKARLQAEAVQSIEKVISGEVGEGAIERVYFTNFVMQ